MKLQNDSIQPRVRLNKRQLYLFSLLFFSFVMSGCAFEVSDLDINVVNLSHERLYVGSLFTGCDTCKINMDVDFFCSNKAIPQDLRVIASGDSIQLRGKTVSDSIRFYSLNADSLDQYCNKNLKYSVAQKSWLKNYSAKVDRERKTCTIKIN